MSVKDITRTKMYRALVTAGLSPDAAAKEYRSLNGITEPAVPVVDPNAEAIAQLVAAGVPEARAKALLAAKGGAPTEPQRPALPVSPKAIAEALVAERGLTYAKGRIYANAAVIEAQARVLKTGKPEVVKTSGNGRVPAVLVYRETSGDVAVQNLAEPSA